MATFGALVKRRRNGIWTYLFRCGGSGSTAVLRFGANGSEVCGVPAGGLFWGRVSDCHDGRLSLESLSACESIREKS